MLHAVHHPSSDPRFGKQHIFGILIFQQKSDDPTNSPTDEEPVHQTRQSVSGTRKKGKIQLKAKLKNMHTAIAIKLWK